MIAWLGLAIVCIIIVGWLLLAMESIAETLDELFFPTWRARRRTKQRELIQRLANSKSLNPPWWLYVAFFGRSCAVGLASSRTDSFLREGDERDLRWEQVDFRTATLHVRRVKQGSPSTHPILGDELRALRRLKRKQGSLSPFVFTSERGAPFSTAGFARMIERAGAEAKLAFKTHPHVLRHACGYALANRGHDTRALQAYLGHRNIQHTVRYTELTPARFKNFWRQ